MTRTLMIAYTTYVHDARIKRHCQALADRGDEVDLLCLQNPQQGRRNGVNVIGLKLRHYRGSSKAGYLGTYLSFFWAAGFKALKLARAHRYHLVIVCTMPDAAVLCALPLKLLGSKIVLDVHDTMPELYRDKFGGRRGALGARLLALEERVSAALADHVLAVHEPHRQRLIRSGIDGKRITAVLNVPDSNIFISNGALHSQPAFTIVCHGTVARRLGLDVAIRAMAILRNRVPGAKLVVLGSGDYLTECKSLASNLGLSQTVRFEPPVPLEQLPSILRNMTIGLVPNRASSATHLMLPVKLMEYATLGLPVIASRLRTIAYYFDESCVRFFKPDDPDDLANAIESLYDHPLIRMELARNASQRLAAIGWQVQRERYYTALDSLLGGKSAAAAIPGVSE